MDGSTSREGIAPSNQTLGTGAPGFADETEARQAVIAALYDAVIAPERFGHLLSAWDSYFTDPSVATDTDSFGPVAAHFDRAAEAVVHANRPRNDTPQTRLDALTCPAAYVTASGRILSVNAAGTETLGLEAGMDVFDLAFDAKGETFMRRALKSRVPPPSALLRCTPLDGETTEYLIVDPVRDMNDGALMLLRSVRQLWSSALDEALTDAFSLTPAERELLAALFCGESVKGYAKRTERTQPTVRTQLSSILSKSGVPNQVELLRMATSVSGLLGERTSAPALRSVRDGVQMHSEHSVSDDLTIETVMSGDPKGEPVFFTQTTTAPTLTAEVVDALARYGVRLISIVKNGAGKTTQKPVAMGHAGWAKAFLALADMLGIERFGIGGQCSGGIYALALAAAAKERATGCLLVDVGAPLADVSMIMAMPPSPRRHHLASRFCPLVTLAPINTIATDMQNSSEGAARAVRYFYTDSPVDEELIAGRPDLFRVTIDNLNYSFENPRQLVADIAAWSSDSTPYYTAAEKVVPLSFLHGAENRMMNPEALLKFCARNPDRRAAHIVEGTGQLMMWQHPEKFAAAAAALSRRG